MFIRLISVYCVSTNIHDDVLQSRCHSCTEDALHLCINLPLILSECVFSTNPYIKPRTIMQGIAQVNFVAQMAPLWLCVNHEIMENLMLSVHQSNILSNVADKTNKALSQNQRKIFLGKEILF